MQASELQNKFERIRANKWFEALALLLFQRYS